MKPYAAWNALRGTTLTSTERLVLMAVAFRAGGGECFASHATLAEDTGLSESCVRHTLTRLTSTAVLVAELIPGRTTRYTVGALTGFGGASSTTPSCGDRVSTGQGTLSPGDDPLSPGDDPLSPGDDPLSPGDRALSPGDDDSIQYSSPESIHDPIRGLDPLRVTSTRPDQPSGEQTTTPPTPAAGDASVAGPQQLGVLGAVEGVRDARGPAGPDRAPKPRKPRKGLLNPEAKPLTDEWGRQHKEAFGASYPWNFAGPDSGLTAQWVGIFGADLQGFANAVAAYFRAVKAGHAFPHDSPAATHHFTRDVARWVAEGRERPALRLVDGREEKPRSKYTSCNRDPRCGPLYGPGDPEPTDEDWAQWEAEQQAVAK